MTRLFTCVRSLGAATCLVVLGNLYVAATPRQASTSTRQTFGIAPAHAVFRGQRWVDPTFPPDPIPPNQPIKPNCVIWISVSEGSEPSGIYRVDDTGSIHLHIAEQYIPANLTGKTPAQAAATLTAVLKRYLNNPKVTVNLDVSHRPTVFVAGLVHFPRVVHINQHTHLADLLRYSGFLDYADLSRVQIYRQRNADDGYEPVTLVLHADRYLFARPHKAPDLTQNPLLRDQDEIVVPLKTVPNRQGVTLSGEVNHPIEALPLRPHTTLAEALDIV